MGPHPDWIQLKDWDRLAHLPHLWQAEDVQKLFYPEEAAAHAVSSSASRRAAFLFQLDASTYFQVYQMLLHAVDLRFLDIHKVLSAG